MIPIVLIYIQDGQPETHNGVASQQRLLWYRKLYVTMNYDLFVYENKILPL